MFRRFLPLALLVAAVIGCSRNKPDDSPNPGNPTPPANTGPGEPVDPNATYTIKFRQPTKGDKVDVVKTRVGTMSATTMNSTQTQKENIRFEYTETVVDTSPDEPRPTKVTRVYKTAQAADQKGEMHNLSYAGKTVTIGKHLNSYKYDADGQSLLPQEQNAMHDEFSRSGKKFEVMLPKGAVKVGDTWPIDLGAVLQATGKMPFEPHKEKSKITGKLVRAYKKDGQQWGVVEWKLALVFDTVATNGSPIKGTMDSTITFEGAIDGSVRSGTMKMPTKMSVDHRDMIGHEVKTVVDGTQEETFTQLK